jgi:hypothetical protein
MRFLRAALPFFCLFGGIVSAQQPSGGIRLRAVLAPSYHVSPETIPIEFAVNPEEKNPVIVSEALFTTWSLEATSRRLHATAFFEDPHCALRSELQQCIPAEDIEVGVDEAWVGFKAPHGVRLFVQPVRATDRVGRREDRLRLRLRPALSAHFSSAYRGVLRVRLTVE